MKTILKSILISYLFVFTHQYANAQEANKSVSIKVSGSGKTIDEAKQSALRSAIEQAYGTFISTKTEILNDKIVADEMSSVSSGNIQSYEILYESQLPDGSWGVTLKALLSISKLTSFVKAKGIAIEIKGDLFAANIKQQLLNEEGEFKAIREMVILLHEPMQTAFDYVIKSGDPKSIDAESKNWEIPLQVSATSNKNMEFCANYCIKTLAALSLTAEEIAGYVSFNKAVFAVEINYFGSAKKRTFYLRNQRSVSALYEFNSLWEFYARLFTVESGIDVSYGNGELKYQWKDFADRSYNKNLNIINLFIPPGGWSPVTFSWNDKRTLTEIEQMTGYTVKPRGVISKYKNGEFVMIEKD